MPDPNPPRSARALPTLFALCVLLWTAALLVAAAGILLLARAEWGLGGLALLLAVGLAASGLGLYHLKRWGAVLFGALALLGSANYLAGTLNRFSALSGSNLAAALWALANILAAILIPLGLIYVTLALWRWLK